MTTNLSGILQQLAHSEDPTARATLRFLTFSQMESERQRLYRAIRSANLPLRVERNSRDKSLSIYKDCGCTVELSTGEHLTLVPELPTPQSAPAAPALTSPLEDEEKRLRQLLREEGMTEEQITEFLSTP